MLIFADTETTSLPLYEGTPSDDPRQPHIVQLAAILCEDNGRKVSALDVIVRPEGWVIPAEATKVHGITTEFAADVGVSESKAVGLFYEMVGQADLLIAHNLPFDAKIIRIALKRMKVPTQALEWWAGVPGFCTMRHGTNLMQPGPSPKMAAAGMNMNKAVRLEELYAHLFAGKVPEAHDAMGDAIACRACYFRMRQLEREAKSRG